MLHGSKVAFASRTLPIWRLLVQRECLWAVLERDLSRRSTRACRHGAEMEWLLRMNGEGVTRANVDMGVSAHTAWSRKLAPSCGPVWIKTVRCDCDRYPPGKPPQGRQRVLHTPLLHCAMCGLGQMDTIDRLAGLVDADARVDVPTPFQRITNGGR